MFLALNFQMRRQKSKNDGRVIGNLQESTIDFDFGFRSASINLHFCTQLAYCYYNIPGLVNAIASFKLKSKMFISEPIMDK